LTINSKNSKKQNRQSTIMPKNTTKTINNNGNGELQVIPINKDPSVKETVKEIINPCKYNNH